MKEITLFEFNGTFFTNEKQYSNAHEALLDLEFSIVTIVPISFDNTEILNDVLYVKDNNKKSHKIDVYPKKCDLTNKGIKEGYYINGGHCGGGTIQVNEKEIELCDIYVQRYSYTIDNIKIRYNSYNEFYYTNENDVPFFNLINQIEEKEIDTEKIDKFASENEVSFEYDDIYYTEWEIDNEKFYTEFGLEINL